MKKFIAIMFVISLIITFNSYGQEQASSFLPDESVLNGHKLYGQVTEYKDQKLFDLINGGGEVFFEFGYNTVFSARYVKDEAGITIQLYVMENTIAAYGIYSYHKNPDDKIEDFAGINEINVQPNGVNFFIDKYFIKIESFDEGEEVIANIKKIAANMINKISKSKNVVNTISNPLPSTGIRKKTIKLLAGQITSDSADEFYQGNPLNFSKNIQAFYAKYTIGEDSSAINFGISAINKNLFNKGKVLLKMAGKLYGGKEQALSKSFYVDNLPVLGFTKDGSRFFIYQGNDYNYIFTLVKDGDLVNVLKYINTNKAEFK